MRLHSHFLLYICCKLLSMEIYNEEELIVQLRNPKTQRIAFTEVVLCYGEKLYWQIRKMVLSHEDSNDILQNTFLKAWNDIGHFRGEAKLSTWLYKIAINECLNFLKKQRAVNNISIDSVDLFLVEKLNSDPYFDGDEAALKLQRALITLPEKQRLVFNMKYFDEMKYDEISEILGTTVGALKASYHHAVKKIEAFLTAEF